MLALDRPENWVRGPEPMISHEIYSPRLIPGTHREVKIKDDSYQSSSRLVPRQGGRYQVLYNKVDSI